MYRHLIYIARKQLWNYYCEMDHRMPDVILLFFSIVPHGHPHLAVFYRIHVLKSEISVYLFLSGQKTPPENMVRLNGSLSEAIWPGREHHFAALEGQYAKCGAGIVF